MQIESWFTEATIEDYKNVLSKNLTDEKYGKIIEELSILVWKDLGPYYSEAVYQKALLEVLINCGFCVGTEISIKFTYMDRIITNRRCDLMVSHGNFRAILELKKSDLKTLVDSELHNKKAKDNFLNSHDRQIRYYLSLFGYKVGYLLLFPTKRGFPIFGQELDTSGLITPFISNPIYENVNENNENNEESVENLIENNLETEESNTEVYPESIE